MTGTVPRLIARTALPAAVRGDVVSSTSDALIELLHAVGVRSVYGIVGGGIAPFADVLGRSALRFYAMRHEGGAAFAACEASLAAARPVAVMTTTGPGLTNALTGVLAARSEGAHVIVISACTTPRQRGRFAVQEMSEQGLVSPSAMPSAFDSAATIESPDQLTEVAEKLVRGLARPQGFVAHLSLSLSVQRAPYDGRILVRRGRDAPAPAEERVIAVARALDEPFAIWAGFGARRAAAELRAFAEKTGAPVMLTPRGKGIFPKITRSSSASRGSAATTSTRASRPSPSSGRWCSARAWASSPLAGAMRSRRRTASCTSTSIPPPFTRPIHARPRSP